MSIVSGYGELLRPRFFLEANGGAADDLLPFITRVEYEEASNKPDQLTLTIANPGLRFMNDPRFNEGARFRFRFGYMADLSEAKNVVIAKARPRYTHQPVITMVAWGLQKDMDKKSNPVNWGSVSSSHIAREIAKRYGFTPDIAESSDARRQHRVQPANTTDIQYVMSLANKLNWDAYIEGTTFHFHPRRYDRQSSLEFIFYTDGTGTLIEFEPDVNLNKAPKQGVVGTDTKSGDKAHGGGAEGTASKPLRRGLSATGMLFDTDNNKDSALIPGVAGPHAFNGEGGMLSPSHESDKKVIKLHGAAHAQRIDMNALKASAEMVGTPRLRARAMIRIAGVDRIYTGNWYVGKARHIIEAKSYRTSCELKRDSGKAAKKTQNKNDNKDGAAKNDKGKRALVEGLTALGKLFGF